MAEPHSPKGKPRLCPELLGPSLGQPATRPPLLASLLASSFQPPFLASSPSLLGYLSLLPGHTGEQFLRAHRDVTL
jgi:hypothetical protein